MLRLLSRLNPFRRRRHPLEDQSLYIFHYHDGTRERSADPTAIERSLIESLGEDWRMVALDAMKPLPEGAIGDIALKAREDRDAAHKKWIAAVDKAFDIHEYTDKTNPPSGLIEPMRENVYHCFILFCHDCMELARPFESAHARASPSPENSPPTNGSVSSSTETPSEPTAPKT